MRYLVSVGQETLELEVERHPDGGYRVHGAGGAVMRVLSLSSRAGLVSLLVDGQRIEVQPSESEVHFRQERFTVRAESPLERATSRAAPSIGALSKKLTASMPGRIVRVLCEVGAAVLEGTPLVVIEAMKMQNELCAKADAVVSAVHAQAGQTVERGALLLEFE